MCRRRRFRTVEPAPDHPDRGPAATRRTRPRERDDDMILATTQVEELDRFVEIFSTKGAEKRKTVKIVPVAA